MRKEEKGIRRKEEKEEKEKRNLHSARDFNLAR